jgi:hypothetical protein
MVRVAGVVLRAAWRAAGWSSSGRFPPLASDLGLPDEAMVVVPAAGQSVYRVIGRSSPLARDFESNRDRGRPRFPRQDYIDFVGISVFGSLEAALASAARFPKLVAEVHLNAGAGLTIARTLPDIAEHYSVWGAPEDLLDRVVTVARVDAPEVDSP